MPLQIIKLILREISSDVKNVRADLTYVPVAQLDRVSDSDSEGRAFESHRAYQKIRTLLCADFLLITYSFFTIP